MRTQDQKRAQHAYDEVQRLRDDKKSKFKTLALKFPAMVQQCGLLQTLAFCEQKNIEVYNAITGWLAQQQILTPQAQTQQGGETFFQRVCREQLGPYRLLSREALAYGTWLKRAVEVLLKDVKAED
mgnify:CR=1 FL=1|uniref:CRISPR type III-B/RAMP module-associated protein Cmr5 n=1 Tax=Desulfobacca acetoxidans TaxID=60893 RepID=A0A7V4G9L3_9BACT